MTEPAETIVRAWQPLTPRGVAAFARTPLRRLLLVQCAFAVLLAASIVWFFDAAWFPAIRKAIRQLPARGEIRSGKLDWPAASPQLLADGHFLALAVDLNHTGEIRSPAHLQVEFGRHTVRFISLLGYTDRAYPADPWIVDFNRPDLEPWWGAWQLPLLGAAAAVVVAGSMAVWALLSTVYLLPLWLTGFYANRDLSLWNTWKLSGAALMPGSLLLAAGIALYGAGALDLVQLMAIAAAHLIAGWVYAVAGAFSAPKLTSAVSGRRNPFTTPAGRDKTPPPPENPPLS